MSLSPADRLAILELITRRAVAPAR